MRGLGVVPVALGKRDQAGDLGVGDVVDDRAHGAGLLEPVALPQRAGPDALERAGLVVGAAGHGAAVDGVDDARGGEEPHLVAPFLGVAGGVAGVVVVEEVEVFDVVVEAGVEGGVGLEGHGCGLRYGGWVVLC